MMQNQRKRIIVGLIAVEALVWILLSMNSASIFRQSKYLLYTANNIECEF